MAPVRGKVVNIDEQEILSEITSSNGEHTESATWRSGEQPGIRSVFSGLSRHQTASSLSVEEPPLHNAETGLRAVRVALKVLDRSRQTLTDAEAALIESHKVVDRAKAEVDDNTRRLADGLIEHHSNTSDDLVDLFASSTDAIQRLDAALIELKFAHSWCLSAYQMHVAHVAAEERARSLLAQQAQAAE